MAHVIGPSTALKSDNVVSKRPGEIVDAPEAVLELDHAIGYTSVARNGIVLHPAGKHYIVVSGACLVINNLDDPREQSFLSGHTQTITCIDVTRSGSLIASGQQGVESDVIVWDYDTKSIRYRFEEHQFGIAAVCFSWDERFLVTVGSALSGRLIVWDMNSGYIVGASQVAPVPFNGIAWGGRVKDMKRRPTLDCQFATCGQDESYIHMWKLTPSTGQLSYDILRTGSFKRIYSAIQFSNDAEYLFAGSTTGDVSVFYVRNGGLCTTFRACSGGVLSLAPTMGLTVLVGGGDCTISRFQAESPKQFTQTHRTRLSGGISTITIGPDHREAVVGTSVGDAYRLSASSPSDNLLLSQSHSGCVHAVAFPRNASDRFASCSDDGTIKVWDISDYSLICSGSAESHIASSLTISEECIISGWEDGRIRSMDISTGDHLWHINNAHSSGISALCLSPNEKFLVSGGLEGDVRVWELRKRELLCHLKEHTGHVANLAIYNDNRRAITCSRDRSILCWDLQMEQRISCHRQNMGGINDISINHDESLVVSVGQEKRVTFWDLRLLQAVALIELDAEGRSIDINSAGNLFAVGDDKTYAKLFDIRTMRLLSTGTGHSRSLTCVRFSPDGKQLVSSSQGGNIFIWNAFQL